MELPRRVVNEQCYGLIKAWAVVELRGSQVGIRQSGRGRGGEG